jgi:16S rRNA (uracil1498-N3)-methyltransferase
MHRFFIGNQLPEGNRITITGPETHHLKNVLRLKAGARIICFDGQGTEYEAELERFGESEITARIIERRTEPPDRCRLTMGQGLLTGHKMDLVVQKATELGIATLIPFTSRYCTVRDPATAKAMRWQRIAREACKQCRRAREPEIRPVHTWAESLALANDHDLTIIFWEKETGKTLSDLGELITRQPPSSLLFLVGPEGGLAEEEIALARPSNILTIGLGRRILRAETASLAAAVLVQYLVGNLE